MRQADTNGRAERATPAGGADAVIDQIPAAIALFDGDLRCVTVNAAWQRQFRVPWGDPVGRDCDALLLSPRPSLRAGLARALGGEASTIGPASAVAGDGSTCWFRSRIAPWRDAQGQVRGALLACEDVTAELEQHLHARMLAEELSLLVDNTDGLGLCRLDDDGRITIWNPGAERLSGWTAADAIGQPFGLLFDAAECADGLPQRQLELARRHGSFRERGWRVRRDGTRFRADVTIARIEGDPLLPGGFGQILRDVTREEFQARSLEANAMLLRSIIATMPDALVVVDIAGTILLFSKAAEAMFGYAASEVVGNNVAILMPDHARDQHDAHMNRYRQTGESRLLGRQRRLIGRRKDGSEFPHSLQIAEAFGGGQRMIAGFMQDLTASEAAAVELERLQRELAHVGRVYEMGTLASTIAHELNQPLMAIANIVQTAAELLKGQDTGKRAAIIKALDEAGEETLRAGDILRRLRDFLSRGELDKTLEDVGKLAEDAVCFEAAAARHRHIACRIDCPAPIPPILVDRVQIQQVILNLVKNAVQSIGRDGTVTVTITAQPPMVRFVVSDTGAGVPQDRVERLFAPFSTTKTDGMGLGLPICRSIIEAHGGRIWHEAAPGGGAAFVFTLPLFHEESDDVE